MEPGRMRRENYQSLDDTKSRMSSSLDEKAEECGQRKCTRKHGKREREQMNMFSLSGLVSVPVNDITEI